MKEYSDSCKITSAIISIAISYFLVVIKFQCTASLVNNIFDNITLWAFIEFGGALLCIIVPVLVSWHIFQYKSYQLLWGLPVIFLLVLVYSPSGFYFIIPKGGIAVPEPASDNWKYGIAISLMFFIIQFSAVSITEGIRTSNEEERRKKVDEE